VQTVLSPVAKAIVPRLTCVHVSFLRQKIVDIFYEPPDVIVIVSRYFYFWLCYLRNSYCICVIIYTCTGGLWHSSLIDRNLITAFIPFLPMERKHVKLCIEDDLRYKNHQVTEDIVNKVADVLPYYPPEAKLFARSGCKWVSQKVDLMLDND